MTGEPIRIVNYEMFQRPRRRARRTVWARSRVHLTRLVRHPQTVLSSRSRNRARR